MQGDSRFWLERHLDVDAAAQPAPGEAPGGESTDLRIEPPVRIDATSDGIGGVALDGPQCGAFDTLDDAVHGGTIDRPRAIGTRVIVAVAHESRTHRRMPRTGHDRPRALRYAPHVIDEDFRSGDDIALAFLGRRYAFSRADFEQRVVRAALDLDLVAGPVSRATRADVVEAAIVGRLDAPRSDAGERIVELQRAGGADPVYWLRKLVFRSAWLDHRIKHGLVDVAYDDAVGTFRLEPGRYPLPGYGHPSFAAVGTGGEPA
jgi:hypothetical protein